MSDRNGIKEELVRQVADIRQRMGSLESKVEDISQDIEEVKRELENLNSFRWRIEGIRTGISFIMGILGAIITILVYLK